jgi:transcriptional regulator with XRE-family HTH domain
VPSKKPSKTPKKKIPNQVLPWLREALGLTQHQLANMIGASHSTIQAIELGRLPLSERFAWRISEQTGVDVRWLRAGKLPNPLPDPQLVRQRYEHTKRGDLAGAYWDHLHPRRRLFWLYIVLRNIAAELGSKGLQASGFEAIIEKILLKCLATVKDRKVRNRVWVESNRVLHSTEALCALLISDAQEMRRAKQETQVQELTLIVDTKRGRPVLDSVRLAPTSLTPLPAEPPTNVPFLVSPPAPVPSPVPETE